jgi:hypothetical protein
MIIITVENGEPITTTLDQFIIDNDGFDDDEIAAMRTAIDDGKTYRGGGGASPMWTITRG